jgi:phage-related minor tail protein
MAVSIPIISEFDGKGIKKAIAEFKNLETTGQKAQFAIKKAAVPAGLALGALGGFLVTAAKGAEEARIADQKLGAVLDTMGYETATDRVSAYAESLEKTIAVDADVIKATQTKLATFGQLTKSVGKANGAFDRATKAALDLAAAGFGSAEGNAVQLGKALQDPIKGLASLAKAGVTFTEQEKDNIRTLVESGKQLEAQDMILKAIEGQVGGTAAASASSFDKMKFAIAGVADTFGDMMLPVIDAIAPKLAEFSAWAAKNPDLLKIVVGGLAAVAAAIVLINIAMALNPFALIAGAVVGLGVLLVVAYKKFEPFKTVVDAVFGGIKFWINNVTIPAIKTMLDVFKTVFNGIASAWNNTVGKISFSIPSWVPKLGGKGFDMPNIPMLAEGGIVNSPTLALIGESGPEAVIPLSKMGGMGGGMNITVQAGLVSTPDQIGQQIIEAIQRAQRRSGQVFAAA